MTKPSLETVSNVVIVLVGVVALGLVGGRVVEINSGPTQPPRPYQQGESIPAGLVDFKQSPQTLLAVVDPDCKFCSLALPVLQQVGEREASPTRLVVVGKRPKPDLEAYLENGKGRCSSGPVDACERPAHQRRPYVHLSRSRRQGHTSVDGSS